MSEIIKGQAIITKMEEIGKQIFSMWILIPEIAKSAVPGQFVSLFCTDGSRLLPRPISICEINKENQLLRLVFRVQGSGTKEFSTYEKGDTIQVMGPLGNGYTLTGNKAILIGGGIGIPPMLELAKQLKAEKQIVLGFSSEQFLVEEFMKYGTVILSTEDGSAGTKGNVIDALRENQVYGDIIYACGPTPMLKGVKAYAKENKILSQLSLEERMACGIGACLACVCKSKEIDHHTNVKNKRICKDGPIFYAEEVEL